MSSLRFEPTFRVALDTLRANPLRTLLSTLGIVMGAASLAAVLALGDGTERLAREQLEQEGMNLVLVQSRTGDMMDGIRVPRTDYPVLALPDAEALLAAIPPPNGVAITLQGAGIADISGRKRGVTVMAQTAFRARMPGPAVGEGRWMTEDEERGPTRVAVVSAKVAEAMGLAPAAAVGKTLSLGTASWQIVGVLRPTRGWRELVAFVPFATAGEAMMPSPTPRLPALVVNSARVEGVQGNRRAVETWVASRGWTGKVEVVSRGPERLEQIADGILMFKILMGAFTAISLLVGGIGIMNVLLASVAERTREIGIRKATGASRRIIVAQFLAESVVIALAGTVIGVVLGLAGAMGVTAIMRAQTQALIYAAVTWQTIAVSMAAAALVGLAFGTYPALRAARLSPVDAIQRE